MNNDETHNDERVVEPGEPQGAQKVYITLEINEVGDVNFGASEQITAGDLHFYLGLAQQKLLISHMAQVQKMQQLQKQLLVPQSPGLIVPR